MEAAPALFSRFSHHIAPALAPGMRCTLFCGSRCAYPAYLVVKLESRTPRRAIRHRTQILLVYIERLPPILIIERERLLGSRVFQRACHEVVAGYCFAALAAAV